MEIREGYKQTEIGVIPEDWECCVTAQILKKNDLSIKIGPFGSQLKKEKLDVNGPYKVYGQENVFKNNFTIGSRFISEEKFTELRSCELHEGDIVISMMGTIGKCAIVPKKYQPGIMDSHLIRLRIDTDTAIPDFTKYVIAESELIQQQMKNLSVGGIMSGLSSNIIKQLIFVIPPISEQQAIATALSDIDGLINSLQKLIDKKKKIKQGAMQELLTGKRRLEGFSGRWNSNTIENTCDCLDHLREPLNENTRINMQGKYPYCGANGILDYINDYRIDDEIILIAEDGGYYDEYLTRPIAYKISGKCWVNNHAHILKAKKGFNQDYIFYSLVHKNILIHLASGTRAKLNKSEMYKIALFFPPTIEEQTAIANILSGMDSEIEALERKLNKYKDIKQGMMQELLTGRIRLLEEAVP